LPVEDDGNLLGENVNVVKNIPEALLHVGMEVGLEVNAEKTKYIFVSRHQAMQQTRYVSVANKSFVNVAELQYFRTTEKHQNCIPEEIKSGPNLGNACYPAVQNPSSCRLLTKIVNVKILILPIF
jgi:hypothetical protein